MKTHDDLNQLALDYLFGLADDAESRTKLQTPEGQAALQEAKRFRSVLSDAARLQFPDARFVAPAATPRSNPAKSNHRWVGWVVAATVLAALSIPLSAQVLESRLLAHRAEAAREFAKSERAKFDRDADSWRTSVLAAAAERDAARTAFVKENLTVAEKLEKVRQDVTNKQLNVVVTGPAAITPGAPNIFQIEAKNLAGQLTPVKLSTRVVDQVGRIVYEPPTVDCRGTYDLQLPADLPLTPDRDLSLEVSAIGPSGPKSELKQKLALAAPVYLAHLTTDKPMYQPGETVHFRALILDRFKLQPPIEDLSLTFSVLDPQGAELNNLTGSSRLIGTNKEKLKGLGAGDYTLPESAPGGEYTIRLRESTGRAPEQIRKILVNRYIPAQLQKELEFTRKSYGPGDEVVAACKVSRVSGAVAKQPVKAEAQADGQSLQVEHAATTDSNGAVSVKFRLPKELERGSASVTVTFTDGGAVETLVKPVPVVVKKLAVEFFPEGGDLIAGVNNRVYLQVRSPLGKPADLTGRIIRPDGTTVAQVQTLNDDVEPGINQGQARFEFSPELGVKYRLAIDKPEGIVSEHVLPDAKRDGVAINTGVGVTTDTEPLKFDIAVAGSEKQLIVGAYARGRLLAHERLTGSPGKSTPVTLQATPGFGGVTRVTVFEERGDGPARQMVPVAERLVFRKPAKRVDVSVAPDKIAYATGDKVQLKLSAKDEAGKTVPAIAVLGVVNKSVVVMADEKTFRSMPTHFLLTSEVEKADDFEHVDVVMGPHPKAPAALDLLLGVQGWRRFVEQGPAMPPGAGDKRVEAVKAPAAPILKTDSFQAARKSMVEVLRPVFEAARSRVEKAESTFDVVVTPPANLLAASQRLQANERDAAAAEARLRDSQEQRREQWRSLLPFATILLGIGAVSGLILSWACGSQLIVASTLALLAALGCAVGWYSVHAPGNAHIELATTDPLGTMPKSQTGSATAPDVATLQPLLNDEQKQFYGFLDMVQKGKSAEDQLALNRIYKVDVEKEAQKRVLGIGGAPAPGREVFLGMAVNQPPPAAAEPLRGLVVDHAGKPGAEWKMPAGPAGRPDEAPKADNKDRARVPIAGQPVGGFSDDARNALQLRFKREEAAAGRRLVRGQLELGELADLDRGYRQLEEALNKSPDRQRGLFASELHSRQANFVNLDPVILSWRVKEADLMGQFGPAHPAVQRARKQIDTLRQIYSQQVQINSGTPQPAPFVLREFAHVHKPSPDGVRDDFAETVFWHPALIIPGEGTSVGFDLSDNIVKYQYLAAAHTLDGRLGSVRGEFAARKPLTVEPKLPVEITAGDRVDVPVVIANETDKPRDVKMSLESPGLIPVGQQPDLNWQQAANSRSRRVFGFRPLHVEGTSRLRLKLANEDAVERTIPIVAAGFPINGQIAEELRGEAKHVVTLPNTWVNGTLKAEVALFPTPLAELQRGLEGLLREPYGCFEQTSTINYPNTLIMDYLRETGQAAPDAVAKAKRYLDMGYQKLVSYEVASANTKAGYEWFGHAPAHEALTAYGLMQFRDMARVADVNPDMIDRTRKYLVSRRDGKGGFQRDPKALDTFGRAPANVTNAYIVWAITESGKDDDVTTELNRLEEEARTAADPYFLALVANALINRDRAAAAGDLLSKLVVSQDKDGSLMGTTQSITGSHGQALKVETTALAVLGWLKANKGGEYSAPLRSAVKWIGQQRQGQGNFGPTQSTIMALKSLVAYARAYKQPPEAGTMTLMAGEQVLATADYAADRQDAIVLTIPEPEKWLKSGDNSLTIRTTGKNFYPYTVGWSYQTLQPPSAAGCAVKLATKLDKADLNEGESTRLNVSVENVSKKGQGMAVAIIGLPAGMKLPDDFKQLRELARPRDGKSGPIGFFEMRGRELVLYWRDLAPDAKVELALDVIADIPGKYQGPASRAYLYYDPEAKHWVAPLSATVTAAK